ncbi:MAG: efflux RND transporter permease subunit [Nitrospirae bacterium YQR-1]
MNLSEIWIKRPVATTIVMCALLIFGLLSYNNLPLDYLPTVDFPTIVVSASLPGAGAETMAASVATPLEEQFSQIAGLEAMTSTSTTGSTSITLQFSLNRHIDAAAQDVNSYISAAMAKLPPDMPAPPTYKKTNPADNPIIYITLNSETMPMAALYEYASTFIGKRISMINGVSEVAIYGSKYAVRIKVDPNKLASMGIGIDEVAKTVKTGNVNMPTGTIEGPYRSYIIKTTGQLFDAKSYEPLIVSYSQGYPVRIRDVATVHDSTSNDKLNAWYVSKDRATESIILAVKRQPGSNTVEVADRIEKMLPQIKLKIPESVNVFMLYNRADFIRASVRDVLFTLFFTIILVTIVIFIFLRSARATVIPGVAVPLSIIGTFSVMYILNYSLNTLSLMALTLSVGFVVDDAVVMLENIYRHTEMGKRPLEASFTGSREIGFTIISMTISLVVVFIPILFMAGIMGRLFHEFAISIGVAILISGFVSLSLTPMMCSRFLIHKNNEQQHSRRYAIFEKFFDGMFRLYSGSLKFILRHKFATLVVTVLIFLETFHLFAVIPKGFIPTEDQNFFIVATKGDDDISFDDMVAHHKQVERIVMKHPDVQNMVSVVGFQGNNSGIIFPILKNLYTRKKSVDQIIMELWPQANSVSGIWAFLQNPPPIQLGAHQTFSTYQFTLQSTDVAELYKYGSMLTEKMAKLHGLNSVNNDLVLNTPRLDVKINRDKASALGLNIGQIQDALYTAYGTRLISTIYGDTNEYDVILEVQEQYEKNPAALSMLYLKGGNSKLVPLSTIAAISESSGPLQINHTGQLPSATISFNLNPGTSVGDAVSKVTELAREVLPETITASFQGSAQEFQKSSNTMLVLLIITIAVIYMVLAILYESFVHPLTILTSLPLAGFGALVTLVLFHKELDMYAFVGVIMLVGLVKKNGIMMVDFALTLERSGSSTAEDSIYQACMVRFRPIMMTTMAALLGALPIALGIGAGAQARQPLGLAIVGGLLFSQMLTLYVTPVFYVYLDRINRRFTAK